MIQNLIWASGYNVVALPLAAGILVRAGILLSPAVGALLMSLSTVIVALNAQFLRRLDLSQVKFFVLSGVSDRRTQTKRASPSMRRLLRVVPVPDA